MPKTYFEEMAERLLYEKRRQQGYFQPEQDESIEDMVDRYMAARQTNEQMAGPQKLRPLGAFTDAFMQSLAQKPAMMVRGATAFTGENVDEVLGAAAKRMESLVDPERKARADAALQGKLWPSQEDTPWYKIDPKLLPEVINTWSAQVGDQIPIMVSAVIGRVIGAKAGSIAGSAAGPGGALTGAAVGGLTGGWVPMAGMEAGGFLREAQYYNIDKDIAEKYARIHGPAAGAIEYVQQLWNLKAFKGISQDAQKKVIRQILEHIGGNIWEGLEEVTQEGLGRYLMGRAIDEMEARYPGLKVEKPKVLSKEDSRREFGVGFGIGTIAGGAGTVRSEGARQFHRYIGQDARQVALTEKGAAGIARINPEWAKEMAEKEKPSRTDFEKVGLKGWSSAERQELSSLLKESLAKQEAKRLEIEEERAAQEAERHRIKEEEIAAQEAEQRETEEEERPTQETEQREIEEEERPTQETDWRAVEIEEEIAEQEAEWRKIKEEEEIAEQEAEWRKTKKERIEAILQPKTEISSPISPKESDAAETPAAPAVTKGRKKTYKIRPDVVANLKDIFSIQQVAGDGVQAEHQSLGPVLQEFIGKLRNHLGNEIISNAASGRTWNVALNAETVDALYDYLSEQYAEAVQYAKETGREGFQKRRIEKAMEAIGRKPKTEISSPISPKEPDAAETPAAPVLEEKKEIIVPKEAPAEKIVETPAPQAAQPSPKKPVEITKLESNTIQQVNTENVQADPKRFQYKLEATGEGGVTPKLEGVETWNEKAAGIILVWQDKEGNLFVVDGHHRLALAKKLGVKKLNAYILREVDGISDKDARIFGAMSNLADEKGTAVDAAKLFRDSDMTPADLAKEGINIKSEIVKQGLAMKTLSDEVFRMVIDGKIPANMAAQIGRHLTDPTKQMEVAKMIADGKVESARQAELLAKTIDSAPILTKTEQTLFGPEVTEKSLFAERAKILEHVEQILKTRKKVFGVLSQKANIIEQAGNVLNKNANLQAKEQADEVLYFLEKMVNSKGPVSEALNEATKKYAENPTKQRLGEISRELLDKWEKELTLEGIRGLREGLPQPKNQVIEGIELFPPDPESTEGMASRLYAGKTEDVGGPRANVPNPAVAFGIKELVSLARELLGDVPTIRKRISGSTVYGRFLAGDIGKILIKASAATGPVVAQTNWMKKGLTKEQIEILREQQAKEWDVSPEEIEFEKHVKNNRIQYDVLILDPDFMAKILAHEIGHAADWFPDKNMKRGNILGHIAALNKFTKAMIGNRPETLDHIITPKEKAKFERQARRMIKAIHPGRMKPGERNKLVREAKRELIREEVEKRGIFTRSDIMNELKALSEWWSPLTGDEDTKHLKYRRRPSELYADAISVLLNNPDALKQRAPKFYESFFNYLSQRPEFKEAYTKILSQIYNGTTLQEALDRIDAGMLRGSELHLKQLKASGIKKNEIVKGLRAMFYSKFAEVYPLARAARREGLITAEEDPIIATAEYRATANMIEGMMNQLQTEVYETLVKHGIPLTDYEKYLLAMRVISERGLKAAPEGLTDTDFEQWINDKKKQYGERFKAFEEAHEAQWRIYNREVLDRIEAAEYYDDETMQKLRDEIYYARFDVVDYIEQRKGGFGNGLKLYERIGTFREIAPPLESTILQAMGMLYSANWNSAKRAVAQLNVKLDKAMQAEQKWDANKQAMRFVEPQDKDLRLLLYMHKGEIHGFYVDKWQAVGFQRQDPTVWQAVAHVANAIAGAQKAIYTALNPAFWGVNILKDSMRTAINVPGANPLNVIFGAIKALPLGWQSEYGTDSPELLEMHRHGAFISRANIAGLADPSRLSVELMSMYTGRKYKKGKTTPLSAAAKAWEFYKHLGQVSERASKIAAWRLIREKHPEMSLREVAHMVRTEAGSPDFAEHGFLTWAINPFMLFVNPGVQGLATDLRIASEPGRRGSFWMKMAVYQILPKLVQWAVGSGVVTALLKAMGADDDDEWYKYAKEAEDIVSSQSDYVQTNYIVVPLGREETGKPVVLSIPMDHTGMAIGGLMHNILNANKRGIVKALVNSMHYAVEQMPGGTQPLMTLAKWWSDYSIGRNPYDEWRDRKVIPQTVFDARELDPQKEALKILAKESLMQLGAGGFYRFDTGDPDRIKSTLEKTTYLPGIGPILSRWVRISDYGVRQDLEDVKEEVGAERKMELLRVQRAVRKAARGEVLTAEEEQVLQDNVAYSREQAKKLDIRTKGDAIAQSLATASYDQRVAIYRKLRKDKGPKFDLTDYAEKDIISAGQVLQRRYTGARGQDPRKFRDERAEAMELLNILNVSVAEAIRAYRLHEARQKMMSSRR